MAIRRSGGGGGVRATGDRPRTRSGGSRPQTNADFHALAGTAQRRIFGRLLGDSTENESKIAPILFVVSIMRLARGEPSPSQKGFHDRFDMTAAQRSEVDMYVASLQEATTPAEWNAKEITLHRLAQGVEEGLVEESEWLAFFGLK